MPRPRKCRKVCCLPKINEIHPAGGTNECVTLTVDEYESIRLIDNEGFSQQECAGYMQISRTTVQNICDSARGKIAKALVGGTGIRIEGGDYILCDGEERQCGCGGCHKHSRAKYSEKCK